MTLRQFFERQKVASLDQLEKILGVSRRTVLRRLGDAGYFSSCNHNSRFYTIVGIPKFGRSHLWTYKGISFTDLGSLINFLVHHVEQSAAGCSAEELSELVQTRVVNQMRVLAKAGRLKRTRFTIGYVYFALDPIISRRQLNRRMKTLGEKPIVEPGGFVTVELPGGLSHEQIVHILTIMLNKPQYGLKALSRSLDREGLVVSVEALNELVDAYHLKRYRKKEHRLLGVLLEHLAAVTGQARWGSGEQTIPFVPHRQTCPAAECDLRLSVYKTQKQKVYSVRYGNFTAKTRYLYCEDHAYNEADPESVLSYRSEPLAKIVGSSRRYAYDVMCHIGVSRFLQSRQLQEICTELADDYSIPISAAHASRLSDEFLIRLSCLHASYQHHLRRLIRDRGGYYLHLDASCENKSSTVFMGLDSVTGWVLISEKIPSEREEFIVPVLKDLRRSFGKPEGVMRDMSQAIGNAVARVLSNVPDRICHFHFLKDVGKDILSTTYSRIRALMINEKVAPKLNSLRRELFGPLKIHRPDTKKLDELLNGKRRWTRKVYMSLDLLVLVATIDWVMDYAHDGSGLGFPFDHSYRYFYDRCESAYASLLALQRCVSSTQFKDANLDSLVFVLARVCERGYQSAKDLEETSNRFDAKVSEFDRLRRVMRFYCNPKAPLSDELGFTSVAEMRTANIELRRYLNETRRRLRTTRQQSRREAMAIEITHLEKYWEHLEVKPSESGYCGPRTNNDEERDYRGIKKRLRRATGRQDISQEFDRLGAFIPLTKNLENPSYVQHVIGSLEDLPEALADLPQRLIEKQTEKFYESRHGVAYKLRKAIDTPRLLETMNS
jgi:hypothetical protein